MILGRFAAYAIGGLIVVALFFGYLIHTDGLHKGLWVLVAVVVGMVALSLYLGRKSLGAIVDCFQERVATVEGPVTKDFEVSTDGSVSYYYKLDKSVFRVNEAGYEALVAGLTYRLCLLPRSQKLVNIEEPHFDGFAHHTSGGASCIKSTY